ncbi:MAG: hypothetical protein HY863_04395 [Chloroflexi bacterium]|nr:hypothetical protein [Chloroflexota bacterium]
MLKRAITFIIICLIITACANQAVNAPLQATQTHPNQEAYPNPDAETYAKNYGISLDEAFRRFHLQDVAGELQATLREKEADTFASIWLEHTPEFKIVVLFTRDAERTIQPIVIPNNVEIITVWKLGQSGEAANPPSLGGHFPQLKNPPNVYVDLPAIKGELVLDHGCLRVNGVENMFAEGGSLLLIWDARFSTRTEQGIVQVIDSLTGNVLASIGDYVMVGYAGDFTGRTVNPIPEECSEPYFVVGESIKKIDRP